MSAKSHFKKYFDIDERIDLVGYTFHNMDELYMCMNEYVRKQVNEVVKNTDIADESERHEQGLTLNVNEYPVSGFSFRMGAKFVKDFLIHRLAETETTTYLNDHEKK